MFDTGNARKTDAVDAHAVAMVAVRSPRLNQLAYDEELVALRLVTDRRDELSQLRVRTVNRLHRLLTELVPGGAKHDLSALQAKELLASVRPTTLVGKTLRRMAAEQAADLVAVDAKLRALERELRAAVQDRGSHLMDLDGIGPAGAATGCPGPGTRLNHVLHIVAIAQPRHRREDPLPPQARRGQDPDGGPAVPEATDLRRGLPPAGRRRHHSRRR